MADLLAEEHVPVVSGPYMTDRSKPEIRNLSDAAPGLLCLSLIHILRKKYSFALYNSSRMMPAVAMRVTGVSSLS